MEFIDNCKEKVKNAAHKTKEWLSDRWWDIKSFANDHPNETIGIACLAVTGIAKVSSSIRKTKTEEREDLIENSCYDHSLGHRWILRRKITNEEMLEINRRRKAGENLGDILESLKLLK